MCASGVGGAYKADYPLPEAFYTFVIFRPRLDIEAQAAWSLVPIQSSDSSAPKRGQSISAESPSSHNQN